MLATGGADRIISLWELTNDVPIGQLGAHLGDGYGTPGTITSLVFSPDEQLFAASYHTAPDSVWIWSRYQYQITYRIPHHASVEDIHFSPDGQLLASGCADGVARIWQATSGQLVCELYGHTRPITSVAFDKSGQFFATGSADHTINLRNVSNWHEVRQIAGRAHMVFDVAFSPDGRWLVSGGGSVVHVWDVERGKEIHRLPHPCSIYAVAFSPDGKLLATACHDGIVRLWPIAA
jgi:WD40 repeat protein